MALSAVQDRSGNVWLFDPDVIYSIIRAAVRAQLIRRRSRVVENNAGWLLPTTYNLDVNWNGFRSELNSECERYWHNAEMQLRTDPQTMQGNLTGLVTDAVNDMAWFRNETRSAAQRSNSSISRVVSNWETAESVARFVRDGSATFLIVTSGVVSGGAGFAAAGAAGMTGISGGTAMTTLAVGSAMRGAFTYQDTGNVGSAALNAVGSFTVGAIGLTAAGGAAGAASQMSRAEQATVLIISSAAQGTVSGLQAIVEGKGFKVAAAQAGVSALTQAVGGVVGQRIEWMGFFAQSGVGTAIDLAGNIGGNALGDQISRSTPLAVPPTRGACDFAGLPANQAANYVAQYALARRR